MIKALVLRLDAPLMSFGGVMVDHYGYTDQFPGLAMLTGLCANALGLRHGDFEQLQVLQDRLQFAARWDKRPEPLLDYQTVDLGQSKMIGYNPGGRRGDPPIGWTTLGVPEKRAGGVGAKFGTHQRYRYYWSGGLMTVVLALTAPGVPDIDDLAAAFHRPARPLFLGRKTCLPAGPLLDPATPMIEGENLLTILTRVPVWALGHPAALTAEDAGAAEGPQDCLACWPAELGLRGQGEVRRVYDRRNWANQIFSGGRMQAHGWLEVSTP